MKMAMRTQCTLSDIAVLAPLINGPLEKGELARRALGLAEGPCFDEWVALVRAKQPPPARFRRPSTWWARLRAWFRRR